jgi:hypothetical protein
MKAYKGVEVNLRRLTSALAGGEFPDSRPCRLTSRDTQYPLDWSLCGLQSRSPLCGEGKQLLPTPEIEIRFPSLVTVPTELFRILHDTFTLSYISVTEKDVKVR